MRQLTRLDAQFLALENARQAGHVAGLAILDTSTAPGGKLSCGDIQALIADRIPQLPPLRWQLAEQVARITSRPLDRARPLWELYLIHGLESGHVAMLTKIHHALIDGMSGAEIMGLLLDLGPDGPDVSPGPA